MIPGIYDSVAPLTDEELNLYKKIEFDLEEYCLDCGVEKLKHGTKASNSFQLIVLNKFSFCKLPLLSCLCYLSQFVLFFCKMLSGANLNAPLEVPISVTSWY